MAVLNSAKSVEAIKKVGYHNCAKGFYLQVSKQGTKSWLFRYTSPLTKTKRDMGLGSLSYVSLAEVRKLAVENKCFVISRKDPINERKQAQVQLNAIGPIIIRHLFIHLKFSDGKIMQVFSIS